MKIPGKRILKKNHMKNVPLPDGSGIANETAAALAKITQKSSEIANLVDAIAKTSFQGQVIDMVANNVVVVDDVSGKGNGNEISLEQIAALYHFNASYFSTLFKQRFGISFSEYLSDIRMEKAENLLKTSSDKVRKIALEVGYKDPNYFNRAFKKRHNMTPEEFRKRVG